MRLIYHPEAQREVEEAASFYDERATGLGGEFLDAVEAAADRVLENPEIGYPVRPRIQRCLLKRFPYSLLYVVGTNLISVVAVMHHRRRPGYWTDRV